MSPKDAALFWLDQGIASVPLCYRSKKPLVQWTPYRTQLPTEAVIDLWYGDGRLKNIALITGWQNLVIIEFDVPENYAAWYIHNLTFNRDILDTYRVSSNRGIHVYYFLTEPVKLDSIQAALFEVKSSGKLVTTPPSVHESGRVYTSLDDPTNIKVVSPEDILNYSPLHFAPVVYPIGWGSKYAPTYNSSTDLLPEILKIPILRFFDYFEKTDDRFYKTHCPFHGHKNNFWIDTQLNICGCFAGCIGKPSLDVIDFYARLQNIDKKLAIQELKRLL
jgi:hypothetical protein